MDDESSNLSSLPKGAWRWRLTQVFDRHLRHAEEALKALDLNGLYYLAPAIRRRLIQRVIELEYEPFLRASIAQSACAADRGGLSLGSLGIGPSGNILLSRQLRIKLLIDYFGLSIYVSILFLRSLFQFRRVGPATFVSDLGANVDSGGSDARLVHFFKEGPVPPLRSARRFLIQTRRKVNATAPGFCDFSPRPASRLFLENSPNAFEVVKLFIFQAVLAVRFLSQAFFCPGLLLLARDYAFSPLWYGLNRSRSIDGVVLTDANFDVQPLFWSDLPDRTFDVHFLWHSQNTKPLLIRGHGEAWELPHRRYMALTHSWYWTPEFQEWLDDNNVPGAGCAVGPIMFAIDEGSAMYPDNNRIVVFDVSPTHKLWQETNGWPYIHYNYEVCKQLLDDVLAASRVLTARPKVVLKHKRGFGSVHDQRYAEYVRDLASRGDIELAPTDSDIFALVRSSRFVVAAPYTTAALIGLALKVPAFYYDPVSELDGTKFVQTREVQLLSGAEALLVHMTRAFPGEH